MLVPAESSLPPSGPALPPPLTAKPVSHFPASYAAVSQYWSHPAAGSTMCRLETSYNFYVRKNSYKLCSSKRKCVQNLHRNQRFFTQFT